MIKYRVTLTKLEHEQLINLVSKGNHSSQQYRIAYVLLNCDEGKYGDKLTGNEISRVLKISMRMIDRIKQRFIEEGFEACLERKPITNTKLPKVDGDTEAHLIALSCSKAPDGFARWSLRLLAEKMVELKHVDSISHETIRKTLKKTS
jgi:Homeodomain-like domain